MAIFNSLVYQRVFFYSINRVYIEIKYSIVLAKIRWFNMSRLFVFFYGCLNPHNKNPYNVRPPFDRIQLVYNSNFTMVYGTYNYIVTGAYKPTYNWGASHCMNLKKKSDRGSVELNIERLNASHSEARELQKKSSGNQTWLAGQSPI